MKLKELNEMMLNPLTIMKCKKLKAEREKLNDAAGSMMGDPGFHKRVAENSAEMDKLGCDQK